jgi:hypothetical protein
MSNQLEGYAYASSSSLAVFKNRGFGRRLREALAFPSCRRIRSSTNRPCDNHNDCPKASQTLRPLLVLASACRLTVVPKTTDERLDDVQTMYQGDRGSRSDAHKRRQPQPTNRSDRSPNRTLRFRLHSLSAISIGATRAIALRTWTPLFPKFGGLMAFPQKQ